MFFTRPILSNVSLQSTRSTALRRRGAIIALAAAIALPVGWVGVSHLRAADGTIAPAHTVLPTGIDALAQAKYEVDPAAGGTPAGRAAPATAPAPADAPVTDAAAAEEPKPIDIGIGVPAVNSSDTLKQGVKDYKASRYEESIATLQSVNPDDLSKSERKTLTETMSKAESAAEQRKAARADFESGQQALNENKTGDAIKYFESAAKNKYADSGTKRKANEQIAVAEDIRKSMAADMKRTYSSAVADYKAKNYAEAKPKFEELRASGYRAGLFSKSPSDFLKEIDRKMPVEPQPVVAEAPPAEAPTTVPAIVPVPTPPVVVEAPKPPVVTPTPTPTPAPPPPVVTTTPPAPKPPTVTPTPTPTPPPPVVTTTPPAPKPPVVTPAPTPTPPAPPVVRAIPPAPPVTAPVVKVTPATVPSVAVTPATVPSVAVTPATTPVVEEPVVQEEPQRTPKDSYRLAKSQYNSGDWIGARKNFVAAQEGGYKAGLFEKSPTAYLRDMDKKEQANAARAAREAQVAQVTAPDVATTTTAPAVSAAEQELIETAKGTRIREETNIAQAKKLVEAADQARAQQRYDDALRDYSAAAQLDSSNEQAIAGRNMMLELTGKGTAGATLPEIARQQRARRGSIMYEFDTALRQATEATEAANFSAARQALDKARVARNTDPSAFTEAELRDFDARLQSAEIAERSAEEKAQITKAKSDQLQAEEDIRRGKLQKETEVARTIADLTATSRQLIKEARFEEARGVLDQILVVDAQNDYANGVRPFVEDKIQFQEQRQYRESFDRQFTAQLNQAEEKKIPYDDILRYPANWPDISTMRDATVAQSGGATEDLAVQAQLNKSIPEINFAGQPFEVVVDFLRDMTGANIFVNWRALEGQGIDRNQPVTARLHDVKFAKALRTILDDVGGATAKLGYTIDEGVITISTEDELNLNTLTLVYDIRDLIVNIPDFEDAPQFNLQSNTQTSGGGGQGGGGGGGQQGLFGGAGQSQGQNQNGQNQVNRQQLVEEITTLIKTVVAPNSWSDVDPNGPGSLSELQGQLVVKQTPENHQLLRNLLAQIRETKAIQVTIEARFLTVQRNFLEDIGMDLDFVINANAGPDSKTGPIPISQDSESFTSSPITGVPGSIGSLGGAGTGLNSLNVPFTYLDNFQVTLFLRATQAQVNTTLVTAPRVTLFNGQRAFVLVSRQTAYVSDLEAVVGVNATAFNPTIAVLDSGVVLDVQATVSSDRKYVTMTLRPRLSTLIDLQNFTFQTGTNTPQDPNDPNPPPDVLTGIVQQPIIQVTQVNTTVSVPDGGTLLLGGQTVAGEVEREAGVPVLSKIPFVKRLFTNRSMAKDEQVLLILVKPTIIIEREQEQKQFPLLSSKVGATGG